MGMPLIDTATPQPGLLPGVTADTVRLNLLLRQLPVQRHDVLGPLAALRMGLAVQVRRAERGVALPARESLQALRALQSQAAEMLAALARLRAWDARAGETQPPQAVIEFALPMMASAYALRGHELQALPAAPGHTEGRLAVPDACYALLGLLAYALDSSSGSRGSYLLQQQSFGFMLGLAGGRGGADGNLESTAIADCPPPAPAQPVDRPALQALLADIGWTLHGELSQGLHLHWPPAHAGSIK